MKNGERQRGNGEEVAVRDSLQSMEASRAPQREPGGSEPRPKRARAATQGPHERQRERKGRARTTLLLEGALLLSRGPSQPRELRWS